MGRGGAPPCLHVTPVSLRQAAPLGGLTYAIGPHTFAALPALDSAARPPSAFPRAIVKLADFGSAEAGPGGVGEPVRSRHFTTLENAPPEHALLGDASLQASGERGKGGGGCSEH